jgi:hypothetical protein
VGNKIREKQYGFAHNKPMVDFTFSANITEKDGKLADTRACILLKMER